MAKMNCKIETKLGRWVKLGCVERGKLIKQLAVALPLDYYRLIKIINGYAIVPENFEDDVKNVFAEREKTENGPVVVDAANLDSTAT